MKNAINEILPGFGTQQWQRDFEALEDLEKVKEIAHIAMLDVVGLWQQYRALEAENAALKDPFTYIKEGRPETWPPIRTAILLSFAMGGHAVVYPAYYDGQFYRYFLTGAVIHATPYAWQPWPAPAPYPEGE